MPRTRFQAPAAFWLPATLLLAAAIPACRPEPAPCPAGRYVVAGPPLLPGGPGPGDAVVVGADGSVSLESGCPAVSATHRPWRKGTSLKAKWPEGVCTGVGGSPKLTVRFAASCQSIRGTFHARRVHRRFSAELAGGGCGDGVDTPGEICAGLEGPAADPALDHVHDRVVAEGVPDSEISILDGLGPVARTQLEIGFALDATVTDVNGLLERHGATILGTLEDTLRVVVRIPDPGSAPSLEALVAQITSDPAVASVRYADFAVPTLLPANQSVTPDLSQIDHHLAVRGAAAWNARDVLPHPLLGPTVMVGDWFGNGPPGPDFDVVSQDDYALLDPDDHGYHVLGIVAGSFEGDASATGRVTGIHPGGVFARAVDYKTDLGADLANPTHEHLMIARIRAQGAPLVLNSSVGVYCNKGGNPVPCEAGRLGPGTVAWIEKVRGSAQIGVVGAGLENSFLHVAAAANVLPALPGDVDSRLGSYFTASRLLPGLTDAAGNPVPNLSNVLVVENLVNEAGPPYAPLCLNESSKRPGNLAAIGTDVWSMTDASGSAQSLTGTSMAAPQAAGAAALVWSMRPGASPQDVAAILQDTAQPGLDPIPAGFCDPGATSAPVLDVYAALLGADVAGNAPVRRALLDVDEDGVFGEQDVEDFLDAFADASGALDWSRHDLNGDGYTGGDEAASFDLDIDDPPSLEHVSSTIGGASRDFDETALRDLDVLCYYAWSDLYEGDPDQRDLLLEIPCCAAGGYTLTLLGLLPGADFSESIAINDSGAVVGQSGSLAFQWTPLPGERTRGNLQALPLLAGPVGSTVNDINAAGVAAGSSGGQAVLWSGGGNPQPVGPARPPGQFSNAWAISDAGAVVGSTTGGVLGWVASGGTTTFLGGIGNATNEAGVVVGNANFPFGLGLAAFWPSGTPPALFLGSFGGPGSARDVSDKGLIVGQSLTGGPVALPFRSLGSGLTVLPTGPGLDVHGVALGVNERDEIVGWFRTGSFTFEGTHAVLWTDAGAVDLNSQLSDADRTRFILQEAHDINESGQIVGSGVDAPVIQNWRERAFLLTPSCSE